MLQTVRRVTLPILLPGMLAVLMLSVVITLGQFEVPLLFGVGAGAKIFSLRIWLALRSPLGLPEYGLAAAYALHFMLLAYLLFFSYARLTRVANKYATVTGKGYRPSQMRLGGWNYAAWAGISLYLIVAFVFPLFTLVWASLFRYFAPITWDNLVSVATLDAYRTVISGSVFWPALARSFIVAASSATLAVILATFTAWLVVRGRENIASRTLDLLASSSVAVPSAVAAFGFLVFYLAIARWAPIFGTVWILVLAYSFRTTVAYRNSYAGILQMNRELEDASAASGASRLATFRRIIAPLLLPHMSVAWLLLFLLGMHEFTMAVFRTNSQTRTLQRVLVDARSGMQINVNAWDGYLLFQHRSRQKQ